MADVVSRGQVYLRILVRTASLLAAGTGFIVLVGWVHFSHFLPGLKSGRVPMAPSTALLFVLYGIGTFFRSRPQTGHGSHRAIFVLNIAGTLVALTLLICSFLGIHPEIEHLGYSVAGAMGGVPIGHMSPVTAVCFLFVSLSSFALPASITDSLRRARWALYPSSLLLATSFVSVLAYLFGTPLFYTGSFIPPALTTSVAFFALGVALIGLALPCARCIRRRDERVTRTEYSLLLVFLLLAAGIIAVGYIYHLNYARRIRNEVESQLSAIAELKVSDVVRYRRERLGNAAIFVGNSSFSAMVRRFLERPGDNDARRQLRSWIGNPVVRYDTDRISLLDTRGVTRISIPETPEPVDFSVLRRVPEILRSGQVVVHDFYRSGHNRKIYLAILIPILDDRAGKGPLGMLVLRIDPEKYLYPLLRFWPGTTRTAETLLVRRDGDDVLFLNRLKFDRNAPLAMRVPVDPGSEIPAVKAVLGMKGIAEGRDYRGNPVLADVRDVPGSPWFMVTRMGIPEIYAPVQEQLWWMVSLVCVLILAAGAGVGLVWRHQRARTYRERYELLRERAWLQDMISRSLDEIYVFDPTTLRFKFVNTGGVRNIGYGMEELVSMSPTDIMPEYTEEMFRAKIQPLVSRELETLVFETIHRRKDGSDYPVEVHLQRVPAADVVVFLAIVNDITERKRSEEQVARLHLQNENILCSAAEGILGLDLQGRHTFVNPSAARMLGYEVEELLGRPGHSAWHHTKPDGSPCREEECRICATYRDGVAHHEISEVFWSKDGSSFPVEYVSTPIYEKDRLAGAVLSFLDIRDRKQAERALEESEEKFRVLFEESKDGIVLVDADSRKFHTANKTFCDMLRYTHDEIRRKGVSDIHPEQDLPWILEEFDRRWRKETEKGVDITVKRKDGSIIWTEVTSSPVTINGKNYLLNNFRDITERRNAEDTLNRLGMAVGQAAEAIITTNCDGTIQYVNPAFERITGYSRDEAIGKNPRFLRSGMHDESFYREMWKELLSGNVWEGHFINRKKDGTLYEEDATISAIRDSSGYFIGFVAVKRDVTRLLSLEKQARMAQKMEAVGTLAGGIAHDFNNALTGIVGFGELLRMRMAGDEQALHDLGEIQRCAERAATLTRQLLTFARRQVTEPVNLNLSALVTGLMKLVGKVVGEHIEIQTSLEENVPIVYADWGQIEQVVMNLCLNSRDAMPDGGRLVVETEDVYLDKEYVRQNSYMKTGRYAVLAVSDTGIGMDEQIRARVFEPFFTTKGPDKGTGLGLAMVYGIVKQHGGFIHLYSEPGKGTMFKVYIPATDAPPDAIPAVRSEEIIRGGTETILLAEDEESILLYIERALKKLGYDVLVARNGEEAVEIFMQRKEIVLAVLDVVMPRKGGKEAFEEMRKRNPKFKVIFMSGYNANAVHDSFVLIPGLPFLQKPFGPATLARKVRNVLDMEMQ